MGFEGFGLRVQALDGAEQTQLGSPCGDPIIGKMYIPVNIGGPQFLETMKC